MLPDETFQAYEGLTRGAGMLPFGPRTQIEVHGDDRAAFLHNLCTNEIRKLPIGSGCEAFLTNVQGKVLFHVFVWAADDAFIVETVGGQAERLIAHLDRYLIREKVDLSDRSATWSTLLLAGAEADVLLERMGCRIKNSTGVMRHSIAAIADCEVSVRRVPITQPVCYLLSCRTEQAGKVDAALQAAGAKTSSCAALEMARLEAGFPWYGVDVSDDNLAPEVGRDRQAISYVKGCYLGQETIARIDALGHVNRMLTGIMFSGSEIPALGTELWADEKAVGKISSVAYSPRLQAPLALAYVRRGHNQPGQTLQSALGSAKVIGLPLSQ